MLIYRLDRSDPLKQSKARELLRQLATDREPTILPWQVLGELIRQLRYWQDQKHITREMLLRHVATFRKLFPIAMPTLSVVDRAIDLTGRYSLSHWDSMLLGACLEAGVDVLYTEDMGAPVTYDGVHLVNPFS
ncbi:MAG: PIN domain-containing protein [Planctomycetota bacterium]